MYRTWSDASGNEVMEAGGSLFGHFAQGAIEGHVVAVARTSVEERPLGDRRVQHFFQTESLRAQLHHIRVIALGSASLVFDRTDKIPAIGTLPSMELDSIRLPDQPQTQGPKCHPPRDPQVATGLPGSLVYATVEVTALDRKSVVRPYLLDMDERALPLAEEQVLEGG